MNTGLIILSVFVLLSVITVVVLYFTGVFNQLFTPPVDCKVGEWGVCDKTKGTRYRNVIIPRQGTGKECAPLVENCKIDCEVGEWSKCLNNVQTRSILTPAKNDGKECGPISRKCLSPPELQTGTLQWQPNCPEGGDCSGLTWAGTGTSPWDKYYKISCTDGEIESQKVGPYGPVKYDNFSNPKLRLQSNGVNACNTNKVNIYRSITKDGEYTKINPSNLASFSGEEQWDQKDAIFIDKDNSTTY